MDEAKFKKLFPKAVCSYADLLRAMEGFNIKTKAQQDAFIAQCAHESAGFSVLTENLNYSGDALLKVFGKYFSFVEAGNFARKPEKIANRVYANRMGNGDEASGDGWKYRGRGFIQLTGKANYAEFSKDIIPDYPNEILEDPSVVATPEYAALSAAWFWDKRKLNNYVGDYRELTRRINGGYNGYDHRYALLEQVRNA